MKLSVLERVLLGGMMAGYKGSFTNLKLIRQGREVISFSEQENKDLNIQQEGEQLKWNGEASLKYQAVEIKLGETVLNVIKGMLQKLNDNAELTEQHFSLYEKFVETGIETEQPNSSLN